MEEKKSNLLFPAALFLSIIGSSLSTLAFFAAAAFFNPVRNLIGELTNSEIPARISSLYFLILGCLHLVSLIGVLKMRKLQRAGYFFYLGAQVCLIIVPVLHLGGNAFSAVNLIFTLLFVSIYTANLKRLQR